MKNPSIQAIFFDLDGTLRYNVPTADQIINAYLFEHGVQVSDRDHVAAMRWDYHYWASSPDLRDDIIAHSADTDRFWVEYTKRRLLALNLQPEQATALAPHVSMHMADTYRPESIVPTEVRQVLDELKHDGYRMAVISNRDRPFAEVLESHGVAQYFDFSLAAGELDIYKPNPGIFEHALQHANLNARETVYVGDNYYADVVGAKAIGMHAVLCDPDDLFPEVPEVRIRAFSELPQAIEGL